jgi:outer membrane protein assembly complex protein YaeT
VGYSAASGVLAQAQRHDAEDYPMTGTDAILRNATVKVCLLAALAWPAVTGAGRAQTVSGGREMVADIVIIGNKSVTTERIMREVYTRPGVEFTSKGVQEDINRLAQAHLFKHLAVRTQPTSDGRVVVIFEVQEHPNRVREVIFKHAKHLSEDELKSMTKVRKGMPLDTTLNRLAVIEIQDALKKKGRYFASVTLEEGFDETHDRVVFNITEGPVVRVRYCSFHGNEFASGERLRTQIDTSRAILFKSFGGVFQPAMVEEDVHKLEDYYRNNGFLNIRVARELIFSDDFQFVDVVFHVQEGTRFTIKENPTIDGAKALPAEQLFNIPRLKRGDFYSDKIAEADSKNIADYFGWRGYPVSVQKVISSVPEEPGVVRVQYQIEERPPVTVGRVIIIGNTVTRDEVIRREAGIYPGQVLRFPELRLAELRLSRLGIFEANPEKGSRPTVTAIPSEGNPEVQDILIQVKETQTGSFQIGAGYNTDNGLVGTIVLNERNFDITRFPTSWNDILEGKAFRGANQDLRIEAVPGVQLQRYSISWRDPMIFSLPYSFMVSGYYREQQYNEYLERRLGGRFTLAKRLTEIPWLNKWSVNIGVRIEDIEVTNVPLFAPVDYTSVQGHNFLVAPRIGATYDDRDSLLRPTEGGVFDISYEQAFGQYTFPIFNMTASRYFTLVQRKDGSGRQVLALRTQVGIEGDNAPVYERFFAGGMRSIRGFQFRGVGPNQDGFMLGGTFLFLNSIEYQIPILANDSLAFVTFIDSGTAESRVSITNYRVSAGFGFRITIPALGPVPIALDFAFPIAQASTDRQQVFNIFVGMSY